MPYTHKAAVYGASDRIEQALVALQTIASSTRGTIPVPAAEACLALVEDDLRSLRTKLEGARDLLLAEVERIDIQEMTLDEALTEMRRLNATPIEDGAERILAMTE